MGPVLLMLEGFFVGGEVGEFLIGSEGTGPEVIHRPESMASECCREQARDLLHVCGEIVGCLRTIEPEPQAITVRFR